MNEQKIGGHILRSFHLASPGRHDFADHEYFYFHQTIPAGGSLEIERDSMVTIFVLQSGAGAFAKPNEVAQIEGTDVTLAAGQAALEVFVAGVKKAAQKPVYKISPEAEIKVVSKPWGYEMWLNGEHPEYAFKKIFLKGGNRTSLQYHRMKRETNLIFQGQARLHFKQSDVDNDSVQANDIATHSLTGGDALDVFPMGLHRIEAISDIFLFEVSTPHLSDVVRVSDDTNRPDGRIAQEHTSR